jgi:D-3-phosphoglycerate dehydrogenase
MKILIADDVHDCLTRGLVVLGHEVVYQPAITREELIREIGHYEGLVIRTKTRIDENVLSQAVKLKFIGRAGAGVDNIDTAYCDSHGIHYFNAGEANADAVGEQTLATLLALSTNLVKADREVRQMIWDREGNRGFEIKGKTVGIIGYGNTGRAVARKLSGFDVRVLAYDKYLENYGDVFAEAATMDNLFAEADILSIHVPLTDETLHLVNETFLDKFSKPIVVLNLSRGKVVNLQHLVAALQKGRVIGAGLDVLENEKLGTLTAAEMEVFGWLKMAKQTVLTPHIGGWTRESYQKISEVLLQKIKELNPM